MRTGATYIALVRGYAPDWVRLSGGLYVVLTKALRPRLHIRCFVLPGRLLLFTACFAAWRVRPSVPDSGLVQPAAYAPGKEWVPQAGEWKKGGDARYSCRLGSGRRIMGRHNVWAYLPILNYNMIFINVNDKFFCCYKIKRDGGTPQLCSLRAAGRIRLA